MDPCEDRAYLELAIDAARVRYHYKAVNADIKRAMAARDEAAISFLADKVRKLAAIMPPPGESGGESDGGRGRSAEDGDTEDVTVEEIAILALVTESSVGKVLSGWRRAGNVIPKKPKPIPYSVIQPLAAGYWKAKSFRFPTEFSEARKIILADRQSV